MLEATGRWVHRHRRLTLAVWAVLVVAGAVLGGSVFDSAEDVGPRAGAESTVVEQRLDALEADHEQVVALLSGADPVSAQTSDAAGEVLFAVRELPGVADVRDPWTTGAYELVAEDLDSAVVEVDLDHGLGDDEALAVADRVADLLRRTPFPDVAVGGDLLAERTFTDQAVQDAARGEGAALVVLLVVLAVALGGVVAGLLPVATALAAVAVSLLALTCIARVTVVSDFAVNVVTVLGLGLCVDYGLLVLSRFREERAVAGADPDLEAVVGRTLATAGRTVLVSGVTVGTAVAALLVLGDPLLTGLAVGGLVAVLVVTVAGLTLTPALLAVAHRRVPPPRPATRSLLPRLAGLAQARPWPVLVGTLLVLLALAAPVLGLRLGASDARSLPPDSEARRVIEVVERDYPDISTAPVEVLADAVADDPRLGDLQARLVALDDVEDVYLRDGLPDGWSRWTVVPEGTTNGPAAQRVVAQVRAMSGDVTLQVGGPAAELVDDRAALAARAPYAVLAVLVVSGLLLTGLTRAPVVAAKTLVLNLLSLAAMLGVVTLVFQHGWGGPLLGGTVTGSLDLTTPLLLFMFAFGLSMDYHVFLVARIKEEWDAVGVPSRRANDRAVLTGITASGPVVTLAALAISVVFIGFAAGELVNVKEVGVGMTVAILLDVTLVRGLLLPASMTLLGRWNWWRPGRHGADA